MYRLNNTKVYLDQMAPSANQAVPYVDASSDFTQNYRFDCPEQIPIEVSPHLTNSPYKAPHNPLVQGAQFDWFQCMVRASVLKNFCKAAILPAPWLKPGETILNCHYGQQAFASYIHKRCAILHVLPSEVKVNNTPVWLYNAVDLKYPAPACPLIAQQTDSLKWACRNFPDAPVTPESIFGQMPWGTDAMRFVYNYQVEGLWGQNATLLPAIYPALFGSFSLEHFFRHARARFGPDGGLSDQSSGEEDSSPTIYWPPQSSLAGLSQSEAITATVASENAPVSEVTEPATTE